MSNQPIKISDRTVTLLNNFASISPSIILQPGKKLRTISDAGTVIAIATIEEEFPHEFALVDLGKLLSVMKLKNLKCSNIEFGADKLTLVGENTTLDFWRSDVELVAIPADGIDLGVVSFSAAIAHETLSDFIRACGVLGHKVACLENRKGRSLLIGTTSELTHSNDYTVDLGETTLPDSKLMLDVSNMKMVEGNYIISASVEDELAVFESKDGNIKYMIGMMV